MAVAAARHISITYTGDQSYQLGFAAAANANSPAAQELVTYTGAGDNTVTVPTAVAPKAVTIIPPSGNTQAITFKGVAGDTGVALHKTDPSSIGLDTGVASFVLHVAGTVTGLRLIWS